MSHWPEPDYRVADEGVAYVEAIGSDQLQRFCLQFDRLKSAIRIEELDEPWLAIRGILSALRMRLLAMPIPFDSQEIGVVSTRREVERLFKQIGSGDSNSDVVSACIGGLRGIESLTSLNPLGDRVVSILETGERYSRGIVVLKQEWIAPTKKWINDYFGDVGVWSRKDGPAIPIHQLLVLPGRPSNFARMYEETVPFLTAPRAESTCFVQFDFLGLPKVIPGLLDESTSASSRPIRGGFRVPDVIIDESPDEWEKFDWDSIRYRPPARGGPEADEFVQARAVTFADGSHSFVLLSEEGTVQTATSDETGRIKLITKSSTELDLGDVLIIRTEGSEAGHVRDLADNYFDAAQYRLVLENWKARVRDAVTLEGGPAAARRAMGADTGAARNFDNWISPTAIRPRERSDFEIVSRFAGFSLRDADDTWDAMSRIYNAHIQAGHLIRDRLEDGLEGRSLQSLEDAEYIEVEIDGFGTLRASRITGIAPFTDTVPQRFIGVIDPREDD